MTSIHTVTPFTLRRGAWPEEPCRRRDDGIAVKRNRLRHRSWKASRARLLFRREAVDQRQPVEAFLEAPCKIVVPALALQPAPLPDLLHAHAVDQDIMDDGRAIEAELALARVEPQHRLALAFRDRFPCLGAIDIFAGRIDGLRSTLCPFPVVLEGTSGLVLRFVDLAMRMQPTQGIVPDR